MCEHYQAAKFISKKVDTNLVKLKYTHEIHKFHFLGVLTSLGQLRGSHLKRGQDPIRLFRPLKLQPTRSLAVGEHHGANVI